MRQRDSHILLYYTTHTDTAARPGFDVANFQQIYPIAHGKLTIPHTSILLTAFVFNDDDLHSNLFGVSPLTEHGQSATYTNDDLQITAPTPYGPKTILYIRRQKKPATTSGDSLFRSLVSLRLTTSSGANSMSNSPSMLRPHLGHSRSRLFTTHYPKDGSATTLPSPRRFLVGTNLIAPPLHYGTSPRRDPASGLPNQIPRSTINASALFRPAHQLHHFQRTMSWPRRDRRPNAHQHMDPSPLL
jgi:hypothetical protein